MPDPLSPSRECDGPVAKPVDRSFLVWFGALYAGWVLAWIAHGALGRGQLGAPGDRAADAAYWLARKGLIWLMPARRESGREDVLGWLGMRTLPGVQEGLVACAIWIPIQAAEGVLLSRGFPRAGPSTPGR